jgi:hypothetical protein
MTTTRFTPVSRFSGTYASARSRHETSCPPAPMPSWLPCVSRCRIPWTGDENRQALRSRYGDVQTVAAEEECQIARHVVAARGRHRKEHDRRLAALEFVDRPGFDARGQMLEQAAHLDVVRCDNQDVLGLERMRHAIAIDIAPISKEARDFLHYDHRLLWRSLRVTAVGDGNIAKARAVQT